MVSSRSTMVLLSTKSGELLLLTLIYDGRAVQRLDLSKSKASLLASDITSVGNSLFFLGSRLGDSLLVQFSCRSGPAASLPGLRDEGRTIAAGNLFGSATRMYPPSYPRRGCYLPSQICIPEVHFPISVTEKNEKVMVKLEITRDKKRKAAEMIAEEIGSLRKLRKKVKKLTKKYQQFSAVADS